MKIEETVNQIIQVSSSIWIGSFQTSEIFENFYSVKFSWNSEFGHKLIIFIGNNINIIVIIFLHYKIAAKMALEILGYTMGSTMIIGEPTLGCLPLTM